MPRFQVTLPQLLGRGNHTNAVDENDSTRNCSAMEEGLPDEYFVSKFRRAKKNWLAELWLEKTKNSRGLLIYLVPALLNQIFLLQSMSIFLFDRVAQYFQPVVVIFAGALTNSEWTKFVRNNLLVSLQLGAVYMLKDTITAGSYWAPLGRPLNDSYAVVTGASSGIGRILAEMLYDDGYNLVLIARSESVLNSVKNKLVARAEEKAAKVLNQSIIEASEDRDSNSVVSPTRSFEMTDRDVEKFPKSSAKSPPSEIVKDVIVLSCDLRDAWAPNYILKELGNRGILKKIDILVNSAGVGATGAFIESYVEENSDIIDLNIKGTTLLTRLLSPHMKRSSRDPNKIRRHGARILNIGSIAGCAPGPDAAVYSASKAYISSFTLALRRELLGSGVICSLAMPGPVRSGFAESSCSTQSVVFKYPFLSMSPYDASKQIYFGMKQGREMIIPGVLNKMYSMLLVRALPTSVTADLVRFAWGPGFEFKKLMNLRSFWSKATDYGRRSPLFLQQVNTTTHDRVNIDSSPPNSGHDGWTENELRHIPHDEGFVEGQKENWPDDPEVVGNGDASYYS